MPDKQAKTGLPGWAKLVLVLFLGGIVLIAGTLATATFWLGNSGNPEYITAITKTIAILPDPLPKGFHYERAIGWGAISAVIVVHDPDKTVLTLMRAPNPKSQDARQIVEDIQNSDRAGGGPMSSPVDVKASGTQKVGSEDMYYVVGTPKGIPADREQDFAGAVVTHDKQKTILVKGMTPSGNYNMEATKQFLDCIKGF